MNFPVVRSVIYVHVPELHQKIKLRVSVLVTVRLGLMSKIFSEGSVILVPLRYLGRQQTEGIVVVWYLYRTVPFGT